jgi:hypothetical protein
VPGLHTQRESPLIGLCRWRETRLTGQFGDPLVWEVSEGLGVVPRCQGWHPHVLNDLAVCVGRRDRRIDQASVIGLATDARVRFLADTGPSCKAAPMLRTALQSKIRRSAGGLLCSTSPTRRRRHPSRRSMFDPGRREFRS